MLLLRRTLLQYRLTPRVSQAFAKYQYQYPKPQILATIAYSTMSSDKPATESVEQPALPKLSQAEFRLYNRMADMMEGYHEHFRSTWNVIYKACQARKRPAGMSIRSFIATGLRFASHLELHHTIEEQHIFPLLARKMPEFRRELEMLEHHRQIHAGLEGFEQFLKECERGERDLDFAELLATMEVFREVLWVHLAEEVKLLGADNMRKYWTLEEMRGMNF
ncbi:hypothetical protein EDC01DRAFT_641857 [Geopyxis carbonaria]|nr:hypothetical protein EDC01DRAFT_641857 [Geopyxis carbonaria]